MQLIPSMVSPSAHVDLLWEQTDKMKDNAKMFYMIRVLLF